MSILHSIFPSMSERRVKSHLSTVEKINALEAEISVLSDDALKGASLELANLARESFSKKIASLANPHLYTKKDINEALTPFIPKAFALVREAAKRTLNQRHYDVQLIGGLVLQDNAIAEMKTGEGKTQMATLPVYLNALLERGVHVVTVNDYLSRRDAVWMGQIYHALGVTVAVINADTSFIYDPSHVNPQPGETIESAEDRIDKVEDETGSFKVQYEFLRPVTRREAYHADITYGTNSEFGFDYLRDNLERDPSALRQRDFHFAIVDEVDSILIDEARTPLIISAAVADSGELYKKFATIADSLSEGEHYSVNEKYKSIAITDAGIDVTEQALGMGNIYSEGGVKYVHHLENAIKAKAVYKAEVDYIVKDGEILIVDPATGRVKAGHRWSEGLHQAIEAKEGVKIQQESRTQASITFQNYFRLYPKLAGMTGTGLTSAEEFTKVYDLDVISVPTHRPIARLDRKDLIFRTEAGKFQAVVKKIRELHEKGQPVLVGTVSIEKSQELGALLKIAGVPYSLLNAKPEFAEREGETIAQAGKKGAVTIATNMAGRGVDIKLGGVPSTKESADEIRSLGGLYVLGTERHEARRIDNQLRGRSGRQGDPGETQFYVSLEDYLMRNFAGNDFVKNIMARMKIPDDMPIESGMVGRTLESAQTKIEGWYFDSRKHVFEFDNVLNQQRKKIYTDRRSVLLGVTPGHENELISLFEGIKSFAGPEESEKLDEKRKEIDAISGGNQGFIQVFRTIMLQAIDTFWIEHLETMDHLRGSVNLRAYGQRDPLVEYKKSGHELFKQMEVAIKAQAIEMLLNITFDTGTAVEVMEANTFSEKTSSTPLLAQKERPIDILTGNQASGPTQSNSSSAGDIYSKVGRNDTCPCGSGKKFKKCHGK